MGVVLADLGGTNLRLSYADTPSDISTFLIRDHGSFESILSRFMPDPASLYLASAITPLGGIIEDKRFTDTSHWRIDLNELGRKTRITVLNDLEAAAYGLHRIDVSSLPHLLKPSAEQTQFVLPPKILVSIGTGIGHAFIHERTGWPPLVQRTHGGWIMPFGVTQEHEQVIRNLHAAKDRGRDLIIEDIVSGHGLWMLQDLYGKERSLRLYWEFLALYCNTLATVSGGYGGIYLTGGIIDDMVADSSFLPDVFREFFIRPLAASVVESLCATPVYYCHDVNLPILGLSEYRKAHG